MSDPGPLPDADDPFELLGASYDEDLVEVRRRYVRLIKIYRPETHPEEFTRIREAWEMVRATLKLRAAEDRYEAEQEAASAVVDETEPVDDAPWREVWRNAAADDYEPARRGLELLARDPSQGARAWAHRFLVEEKAGVSRPERVWAKALEHHEDVAPWMVALLTPRELREAAAGLSEGWPVLRGVEDRAAARAVMRARITDHLVHDRVADAVAEVLDETYREDALHDHDLARLARDVATAAAWTDTAQAQTVLEVYDAGTETAEGLFDDHLYMALDASDAFRAWSAHFATLEPLHRFIRLASVSDGDVLLHLASALYSDFLTRPGLYFDAFEKIPPTVAAVYLGQIGGLCDVFGVEEEVDRVALTRGIQAADATLDKDSTYSMGYTIGGALFIGGIVAIGIWGWWGVLVLVGCFVLAMVVIFAVQNRVYRKRLRPALVRFIVETGISPLAIGEWIEEHKKSLKEVDDVADKIVEDDSLAATYITTRLGDLLPELEDAASQDEAA